MSVELFKEVTERQPMMALISFSDDLPYLSRDSDSNYQSTHVKVRKTAAVVLAPCGDFRCKGGAI